MPLRKKIPQKNSTCGGCIDSSATGWTSSGGAHDLVGGGVATHPFLYPQSRHEHPEHLKGSENSHYERVGKNCQPSDQVSGTALTAGLISRDNGCRAPSAGEEHQ